jgi:hypothetical protein
MIIWIASYPRSGNTFFRILVKQCFGHETYSIYGEEKDITPNEEIKKDFGMTELPDGKSLDDLRSEDKVYFIKTHGRYEPHMATDKVIYLIRDGREAIESYHKYLQQFSNVARTRYEIISGQKFVSSWAGHVEDWMQEKKAPLLLVRFEDLIDIPVKIMEDVAKFLEFSMNQVIMPTFEELQKKNPEFFRSGKKESWRNKWSIDELFFFWYKNGKVMLEFGYDDETNPFSDTSEISLARLTGREFESLQLELYREINKIKFQINSNNELLKKQEHEFKQREHEYKNKENELLTSLKTLIEYQKTALEKEKEYIKREQNWKKQIDAFRNSTSMKIGLFLTWPIRKLLKIFKKSI